MRKKLFFFLAMALVTLSANASWTQPPYTLTYDKAGEFLKLTKEGCTSYEQTWMGGSTLEGYYGYFSFGPQDPELTFMGNTCIGGHVALPDGTYTLHVQAGTFKFDGVENEAIDITFTVGGSSPESHDITYPASFENGTVTGPSEAAEGDVVTLTVTPNAQYQLASLGINGNYSAATKTGDNTYTFTMPAGNVNIDAQFEGIPVSEIQLEFDEYTLDMSESTTLQLTATVLPEDALDKTITWESQNLDVATVDATGLVTAIAPGTTTIYAKWGTITATCNLTIVNADVNLTAYKNPQEDAYYTTYFNGTVSYQADANVTIYKAVLNADNSALILAAAYENIIPAGNAVILKSAASEIVLTPVVDAAVATDYTDNTLRGVDEETAVSELGMGTVYTLAAEEGVMAFYRYIGANVAAHKAFIGLSTGMSAPRRITLGTNAATGMENTEATIKAEKILRDGQLYILKNGNIYNVQGAVVK